MVDDVKPYYCGQDEGRIRRAPSRWEPERFLASCSLPSAIRRACFDFTIAGRHCCFCCNMTLVFTMDEEWAVNTNSNTVPENYVRTFEAGHVHARSMGGPDVTTNLIPLCHACNCRMGKHQAFEWIEARHPPAPHLEHTDYLTRKQAFATHHC